MAEMRSNSTKDAEFDMRLTLRDSVIDPTTCFVGPLFRPLSMPMKRDPGVVLRQHIASVRVHVSVLKDVYRRPRA